MSEVTGLTETKVYENNGTATDSNGIPPQHVWVLFKGTVTAADMAEAIYEHRAAGIGTVGDTSVSYTDSTSGDTVDIKYTEATGITIDVKVTLDVYNTTTYAATGGDAAIQAALVTYINALDMGEDVDISRLYTPVNTVSGHTITSILISRNPAAEAASDLEMDVDEYATTATGNITIVT